MRSSARARRDLTRRGRSVAWLGLLPALLAIPGCGVLPGPAAAALGEPIPIGTYSVTVTGVRDAWATIVHMPIAGDERGLVVMVDWSGLDALDVFSRRQFLQHFNENRVTLRDESGRTYHARSSDEARLYAREGVAAEMTGSTRNWAIWFVVPRDARGLSALIQNPEPHEGQSAVTIVPLGR
jgi:hypothetical protein